jgi:hypothetical protein
VKRLSFDFVGLYKALLKDIALCYPNDQIEWDRDLSRITHLIEHRGIPISTMDLPTIRKQLDRALSDGRLALTGHIPGGMRWKGSPVPKLFWGLWIKLFDRSGCLRDDIDPNAILFLRTLLDVGKNWVKDCAPKYLYQATKEFYDVEGKMEKGSSFWDDPNIHNRHDNLGDGYPPEDPNEPRLFREGDPRLPSILGYVQRHADRITGLLGTYVPEQWSFRHGPGVVSDLRKTEYKYSFKRWGERLEGVFPITEFGLTAFGLMDRLQPSGIEVDTTESASKLIAVPKTQKTPRLIASEPTAHQWCQQSIKDFLYTRVGLTSLGSSIHFLDQRFNQQAALQGSRDGSISTIDLKSASDRISCNLVEMVFRRNPFLLQAMAACRTRFIVQDIDRESPGLHALRKFSTMGSALTFPVQSLVFLAIAAGVGNYLNPREGMRAVQEKVLIFGDDIIVPREWTDVLVLTLEHLGLVVNHTKTFATGKFRESCGMDAWDGYDVTPPHVSMSPQESNAASIASCAAVSNNFFTKGFWHTARWMQEVIGIEDIPVTKIDSGVFGFRSFSGGRPQRAKRWNRDLHRWEYRCYGIFAKAKIQKQDSAAAGLQYFTERPNPYIKYESGIVVAGKPVSRRTWVPIEQITNNVI